MTSGGDRVARALWYALPGVVFAALLVRLKGHARYLHDPESLMVPTVGRELGHGHYGDWIHYQYNLIQGGIPIDATLAALGFAVFGDHLLAWKWYPLMYGVLGAAAGMVVLRRTAGVAGAVAWVLILTVGPFVLKDALLMPAGHHSSGFVWALGALAVACGGPAGARPGWRRGLAAGVLLGVAMFYMRTAISAGPAVAVALLRGGWRPVVWFAVGTLTLLVLAVADAAAFVASASPYKEWGLGETLATLLWAPRTESLYVEHLPKLQEALGWALRDVFYAPPDSPALNVSYEDVQLRASNVWSTAWASVPGLLVLATLVGAPKPPSEDANSGADHASPSASALRAPLARRWGSAVVLTLVAGYVGTYVLSPFRIDPFLLTPVDEPRFGPGVTGPRYAIAAWFALGVGAAQVFGAVWRWGWPGRIVAAAAAGVLVWTGAVATAVDVDRQMEPPGTWDELKPYHYTKMFGPHRGPSIEAHAACVRAGRGDALSRANHLRAMGWFPVPDPANIEKDPAYLGAAIAELQREHGVPPEDVPFLWHGLGLGVGDLLHATPAGQLSRAIDAVVGVAGTLPDASAAAFIDGFAQGIPPNNESGKEAFDPAVQTACRTPGWYRLCGALLDLNLGADGVPTLPVLPQDLLQRPSTPIGHPGAAFAVGHHLGRVSPWLADDVQALPGSRPAWPESIAAEFRAGWEVGAAARTWRPGDEWSPHLVP